MVSILFKFFLLPPQNSSGMDFIVRLGAVCDCLDFRYVHPDTQGWGVALVLLGAVSSEAGEKLVRFDILKRVSPLCLFK